MRTSCLRSNRHVSCCYNWSICQRPSVGNGDEKDDKPRMDMSEKANGVHEVVLQSDLLQPPSTNKAKFLQADPNVTTDAIEGNVAI